MLLATVPKTVWAAGLSLIELPSTEPGLNPAERVFEELRRVAQDEVDKTIEEKMAAVDRELTSAMGSQGRIRRLVECAGIGDIFQQLSQQFTVRHSGLASILPGVHPA